MSWKILELQPDLYPYESDINLRMDNLRNKVNEILIEGQSLKDFANGHKYFGIHRAGNGFVYREWAPGASALYLTGDFNGWNRTSHPLTRIGNGVWEIYTEELYHLCHYKVVVESVRGLNDRMPLYCNYTYQDPETKDFCAVVWAPEQEFEWHDWDFGNNVPPFIYEAHVGMSSEEPKVNSYRSFADDVLPRIKADGYNTIQLMAIQEHPYYGSFGYHVSNFFASSSRFGNPDDLKHLVNRAHELGIGVLLDLVHSHSVANTAEGINLFDGTEDQFFKAGAAGDHPTWGSKVFDYGKNGVIHFLLSNLKYWLEEYHFDGFRFDGVTSMIYQDHGMYGNPAYFSLNTDTAAITYLQLATELVRQVKWDAILISEDVSGMPGMCLPVSYGGIGFDYRLSMGLPDCFTKCIRDYTDGYWPMGSIVYTLVSRRQGEKVIAYSQSHDQCIVGDQTFISRLCGGELLVGMRKDSDNYIVDRAIALSKLIRLIVLCAGGNGYLNFMGNEFDHPEWVDFPREGNNWSLDYCRRQWSLADNEDLRYKQIGDFDKAMVYLCRDNGVLNVEPNCLFCYEDVQSIGFERNGFIFVFNFHPSNSQTALKVPSAPGRWQCVLSSDDYTFGGEGRISKEYVYDSNGEFTIYLPARTCAVYKKVG